MWLIKGTALSLDSSSNKFPDGKEYVRGCFLLFTAKSIYKSFSVYAHVAQKFSQGTVICYYKISAVSTSDEEISIDLLCLCPGTQFEYD